MPYITQEIRNELDPFIDALVLRARGWSDGANNYIITRILLALYDEESYHTFNRVMGLLECIKQEFYRRRVAKYEDEKIKEQGDVY